MECVITNRRVVCFVEAVENCNAPKCDVIEHLEQKKDWQYFNLKKAKEEN